MSVNHVARIVPVIKVNNRNLNQDFYSKTLGMKSLLEEGAQLSLGDQTRTKIDLRRISKHALSSS